MERITLSPDVLVQELGDELVLLDMQSESYFGLNEVGGRFWQLLVEKPDHEAAVQVLLQEFDVDETTLRADLDQLVTDLTDAGLMKVAA